MNVSNENSQLDDDVQAFLPQQLEQDYLSCLLGSDDIDVQETASDVDPVSSLGIEQAGNALIDSSDETEHHGYITEADQGLLSASQSDKNDTVDNHEQEVSTEQYMSVEKLSSSAPFVCQLMNISGVKFAVPLANFSRLIPLPENLNVNSNTASPCLAKFEWKNKPMFLLALKRIMQPMDTNLNDALNESDKIVLIENDGFGFVCHQLLDTVTVAPEDVLWRDESSQRYWLAGTVKEAGFAILDVKGILLSATNN